MSGWATIEEEQANTIERLHSQLNAALKRATDAEAERDGYRKGADHYYERALTAEASCAGMVAVLQEARARFINIARSQLKDAHAFAGLGRDDIDEALASIDGLKAES